MFVCLGINVPVENCSRIWRSYHYRGRASNFDVYSSFMAIELWWLFSVPHPLWHGTSVYNGHLWGPMTLKPIVERLAVELSLRALTNLVWHDRGSNPDLPHVRRTHYKLSYRGGHLQVCSSSVIKSWNGGKKKIRAGEFHADSGY